MILSNSLIASIDESKIDEIVVSCGGKRTHTERSVHDTNADYIIEDMVVELKILDVDLLEKHSDETLKIFHDWISINYFGKFVDPKSKLFKDGKLHVNIENLYSHMSEKWKRNVDRPFVSRVKKIGQKAAKQIRATKEKFKINSHKSVLFIINNSNLHVSGLDFKSSEVDRYNKSIVRAAYSGTKTREFDLVVLISGMAYNDMLKGTVFVSSVKKYYMTNEEIYEYDNGECVFSDIHEKIISYIMSPSNIFQKNSSIEYRSNSTNSWIKEFNGIFFHYGDDFIFNGNYAFFSFD